MLRKHCRSVTSVVNRNEPLWTSHQQHRQTSCLRPGWRARLEKQPDVLPVRQQATRLQRVMRCVPGQSNASRSSTARIGRCTARSGIATAGGNPWPPTTPWMMRVGEEAATVTMQGRARALCRRSKARMSDRRGPHDQEVLPRLLPTLSARPPCRPTPVGYLTRKVAQDSSFLVLFERLRQHAHECGKYRIGGEALRSAR